MLFILTMMLLSTTQLLIIPPIIIIETDLLMVFISFCWSIDFWKWKIGFSTFTPSLSHTTISYPEYKNPVTTSFHPSSSISHSSMSRDELNCNLNKIDDSFPKSFRYDLISHHQLPSHNHNHPSSISHNQPSSSISHHHDPHHEERSIVSVSHLNCELTKPWSLQLR